ncbi:MAG: aldose epimerase family protein [Verrucomicrobiota bacterium]
MPVEIYGTLKDGREARLFTLSNKNGIIARISEFGAILVSVEVPDKHGQIQDLTHGYDTLPEWENNNSYFGATVGRFGNRIAHGQFSLDGTDYQLATNNEPGGIPCHLHGGITGYDKVLWKGTTIENGVQLSYTSPHGEEGYPGNLSLTITYTLDDDNQLTWQATATTDQATPVNIVHHSYWNLSGDPTTPITDHSLQLHADHFLPTNIGLIPNGELANVADTPMDFRQPEIIGSRIDDDFEPLHFGAGYDHAWVINGQGLRLAAKVTDPKSGRTMELLTDQPAVQFYTGNFLDGQTAGKNGLKYTHRTALCLETETFPDGPNHPDFPNCILRPGETYTHTIVHKFSW